MDQYFVLGNPVEHSKSPLIHAQFANLTGQVIQYERRLVLLDGFIDAIADLVQMDVRGCNVTVPFKFDAFKVAHQASARAELAQAANTLKFEGGSIYCDNTDGVGLVNDIVSNAGIPLGGRDVLLLGAGGAAAGVLAPLLMAKPGRLVVANRSAAKAHELVERHRHHESLQSALESTELECHALEAIHGSFDVIINATASSLSGAGVPVTPQVLRPGALVYDMMYGPASEGMLAWAHAHGARARDGLGMLVEQAAESFHLWRGVRPPTESVLRDLRGSQG